MLSRCDAFRRVLLRNDSTASFLPSTAASIPDVPDVNANALASRRHSHSFGGSTHPAPNINVFLSRPEANDADQFLYLQVELIPNEVTFVFDTSEAEVTAKLELD